MKRTKQQIGQYYNSNCLANKRKQVGTYTFKVPTMCWVLFLSALHTISSNDERELLASPCTGPIFLYEELSKPFRGKEKET